MYRLSDWEANGGWELPPALAAAPGNRRVVLAFELRARGPSLLGCGFLEGILKPPRYTTGGLLTLTGEDDTFAMRDTREPCACEALTRICDRGRRGGGVFVIMYAIHSRGWSLTSARSTVSGTG